MVFRRSREGTSSSAMPYNVFLPHQSFDKHEFLHARHPSSGIIKYSIFKIVLLGS